MLDTAQVASLASPRCVLCMHRISAGTAAPASPNASRLPAAHSNQHMHVWWWPSVLRQAAQLRRSHFWQEQAGRQVM